MRFGVIGCGTVAGYGHIPALAASDEIELAALSDVREARLQELGKKFGVERLYTDYRELLAQPDIDAVTVATPVGSHHEVVMAALKAGKHVFCEKPIATDAEKGWEMVRAAEQAGKLLAVNFEMRAGEVYSEMKSIIESGEIGRVLYMRLLYNWAGPRWAGEERHRLLMTEGMGPVFDCGVHFFDLARWFSNSNISEVNAAGLYVEDFPYPDHVVATCHMESGALAVIDESWVYGHKAPANEAYFVHRIDIEGEKGTITTDRCFGPTQVFKVQSPNGVHIREGKESKAFDRMYHMFVESAKVGHLIDLASGEDGVRAVEAALAANAAVARYYNR